MKFGKTRLDGALTIDLQPIPDERGSFMRVFCEQALADEGLESRFVQHSMSFSKQRGTLRGMHFQNEPHSEVKIVRCLRGAIWDVLLDLRPTSSTFKCWQGFELTADTPRQLYVPKGFAHGFQSLTTDVEVSYLISAPYAPAAASGVRWNDPSFGIEWPLPVTAMSEKDRSWPDFN